MPLRHALGVAGLALALLSGTAQAAPIVYDVDFSVGSATLGTGNVARVSGSITTNGKLGTLKPSDILSFSIASNGYEADRVVYTYADEIQARNDGTLVYNFFSDGDVTFFGPSAFILYISDDDGLIQATNYIGPGTATVASESVDRGFVLVLGRSSLSTVPLPASAPLFGAALLGLAGLGYRAKRKTAAEAI